MLKFIGGTLLIVGTSIGAGILALPVASAQSGFVASSIMLFFCWLIMTTSALMILEVNLWFPEDSNMISMAKHTLGKPGQVIAWIAYVMLLYGLLCAYISGGTDVFNSLLGLIGISTPLWLDTLLFTLILGSIVYSGIAVTDYVNRGLMLVKMASLVILTGLITTHVTQSHLAEGQIHYLPSAVMVMITSFGFATIVPSLRTYFKSDIKKLRKMIILGSFIPLLCYVIWDLAILGTLPLEGNNGLVGVLHSGHVTSQLMTSLQAVINKQSITELSRLFTSVCVLTSFLGVALCLMDFFSDGLKVNKRGKGRALIGVLTFLPSLLIVFYSPGLFIHALTYAGICCVVLLVLMPAAMMLIGVTQKNLVADFALFNNTYFLGFALCLGIALLVFGVFQTFIA